MFFVIVLASIVSYGLLYLAPGGPLLALQQQQQGGADRVTADDIARIKARFELDLYVPVRFMRWFVGLPKGSLTIGGQTFFADWEVGCAQEATSLTMLIYPDGREVLVQPGGCINPVTLAELADRRNTNGILFGDFGLSQQILRDRPVGELIESRLPYTLVLMGVSTLLTLLIAIPIGIYSAVRQYSIFDNIATGLAFIGTSLPTFFFGIILIIVFAVYFKDWGLPYLPPGGATANRDYIIPFFGLTEFRIDAGSFTDHILHFIMPCLVLTFVSIAAWSRFIRSSMLEVLRQDYVRTARAKGVRERLVILKHAFRNALIPFITLVASILPTLVAGAAITESVFNWPGLGRLLIDALNRSDYTVALALLYITLVLQLVGYLISDILYTVADPRIRLS
ncbi:MAG: ABC transporter permease [Chloroflexaceae bacterium]|nr:ABC transporter permease [Chloroflexaceae bacterium]